MELFAHSNYDSVSMTEIAEASGVSRRTVFRYFKSKAEIMDAYAERLARHLIVAFSGRPSTEPVAKSLSEALLSLMDMSPDEKAAARLRNRALLQARDDAYSGRSPHLDEELIALVAHRLKTDPKRDVRPGLIFYTTQAAARAAAQTWIELNDESDFIDHLRPALQYLLKGTRTI